LKARRNIGILKARHNLSKFKVPQRLFFFGGRATYFLGLPVLVP